jgi:hypothetical protein
MQPGGLAGAGQQLHGRRLAGVQVAGRSVMACLQVLGRCTGSWQVGGWEGTWSLSGRRRYGVRVVSSGRAC